MPRIPDRPRNCAECIYRAVDNEGVLRCRRHSPTPGREEHEPAYWPPLPVTQWCGEGSLGNRIGAQHVICETCLFWDYQRGGIQPSFPGALSDRWWQGAGLCRHRAPTPSVDDDQSPVFWRVTNFMSGCGDGDDMDAPEPTEPN